MFSKTRFRKVVKELSELQDPTVSGLKAEVEELKDPTIVDLKAEIELLKLKDKEFDDKIKELKDKVDKIK